MAELTKPLSVVVAIIMSRESILVSQRSAGKPYAGYWEFPGGKIEEGESAQDALKRELQEELAIKLIKANFWFQFSHQYPDKKVDLMIWRVYAFNGEPIAQEGQTIAWIPLTDIKKLHWLEGNKTILEKLYPTS